MQSHFSSGSVSSHFFLPTIIAALFGLLASCSAPTAGVTDVTIVTNVTSMVTGASTSLAVDVKVSGGVSRDVTWTSSNPAVATVDADGLVRALSQGVSVITATSDYDPSKRDTITISVVPLWETKFGTTETDRDAGIAFDGSGRLIVPGYTYGSIAAPNQGEDDAFLRVFEADGRLAWEKQFGTAEPDRATAVDVDEADRIVVAGSISGAIAGPSAGARDALVRIYTPEGAVAWEDQFGSSGEDVPWSVKVSENGRIAVAGFTTGNLFRSLSATDSRNTFIRVYDAEGSVAWEDQFDWSGRSGAYDTAFDADGRLIVVGQRNDVLAGPDEAGLDGFVRVYTRDGTVAWEDTIRTDLDDEVLGVAVDNANRIVVAGYTEGHLAGDAAGSVDAWVRVYEPGGGIAWERQFGTVAEDYAFDLVVDARQRIIIVGATSGDLAGRNTGRWDAFVRAYTPDGEVAWEIQYGSDEDDYAFSIALDDAGRIGISGSTTGDLIGTNTNEELDVYVRLLGPEGTLPTTP